MPLIITAGWIVLPWPRLFFQALASQETLETSPALKQNISGLTSSTVLIFFSLTQGLQFWQKAYVLLPAYVLQELASLLILSLTVEDFFGATGALALSQLVLETAFCVVVIYSATLSKMREFHLMSSATNRQQTFENLLHQGSDGTLIYKQV